MDSHPTKLSGFESLREAAYAIENLRYDALAEFLMHLWSALEERAKRDREADRMQLAVQLERAARSLLTTCAEIHGAWSICKKFMKS